MGIIYIRRPKKKKIARKSVAQKTADRERSKLPKWSKIRIVGGVHSREARAPGVTDLPWDPVD